MLLRITYSNTKMFFKRTLENFKSYFPKGYQRLPKTPPCNPFSCTGSRSINNYREPEKMTTEHRKTISKYIVDSKRPEAINNIHHDGNEAKDEEGSSKCLVTRKLKELETMEAANVDLVHDIEEVLHYYSRLTCPVYRDIIEKFFVQMYSGTFNLSGIFWAFSIYLEAVAILPQLVLLQRSGNVDNLTGQYVFFLGAYRALYILNWIYRYFTDAHFSGWISCISGILQTALYADFFYYYFISWKTNSKLKLPA